MRNNPLDSKRNLALFSASFIFLVTISCQLREKVQEPVAADSSSAKSALLAAKPEPAKGSASSFFETKPKYFTIVAPNGKTALELRDDACQDGVFQDRSQWHGAIATAFGQFPVALVFAKKDGKSELRIAVEDSSVVVANPQTLSPSLAQAICQTPPQEDDSKPRIVKASEDDLKIFRTWLRAAAPDCAYTQPSDKGWDCALPIADPVLAENELNSISKTLVEKWNRQPYLFTRRLMISTSLAKALVAPNKDHALDRICRVMEFSLPQELPVAFVSGRWREATCRKIGPDRWHAAAIGLSKAHSELSFLKVLLERTSTLGTLTIRIPREKIPENELLVSLTPAKEVTDSLAAESAKIWSSESVLNAGEVAKTISGFPSPPPSSCWHPLFSETPELLRLSRYLALAGSDGSITCEVDPKIAAKASLSKGTPPERYVAESIASETEFTVTNGKSKVLRLPQGTYSYVIMGASEDVEETDTQVSSKSSGSISWSKKSPRLLINTW